MDQPAVSLNVSAHRSSAENLKLHGGLHLSQQVQRHTETESEGETHIDREREREEIRGERHGDGEGGRHTQRQS